MKKNESIVWITRFGLIYAIVTGIRKFLKKKRKRRADLQALSDKHLDLYLLMNQWVHVEQEGKNLASYLQELNIKKIAIYGINYMGQTLIDELKETNIQVVYGIDRNADIIMYADVDIFTPDMISDDVDAVVVTAVNYFDEIEEELSKKLNCRIISLEDMLYEV